MRPLSWLLGFALALAPARAAASSIAREPIVRILRQAAPDVRACAARLALPDGRYAVRLAIYDGRVRDVRVIQSPVALTPEAAVCLSGAYRRLRFPEMASIDDGRPEHWSIAFPFILSLEPRLPPAPRVRPRPARVGGPSRRRNFGPLPG